jgi:hypothetical protein
VKKPAAATRRNRTVRCAIYTRKSSEEGLEQEFNSLQAQREACEAFIESQRQEGWVCLRAAYDDGGFSGATMDRPALQRLLATAVAKPAWCTEGGNKFKRDFIGSGPRFHSTGGLRPWPRWHRRYWRTMGNWHWGRPLSPLTLQHISAPGLWTASGVAERMCYFSTVWLVASATLQFKGRIWIASGKSPGIRVSG